MRLVNDITDDMSTYHSFEEINGATPSVIIETGFMNLDREFLTKTPEKPAQGIVDGIMCYIRNQPINTDQNTHTMTDNLTEKALEAVLAAKKALAANNHAEAHQYARLAVQCDPNLEDSWLVMAATASPGAAVGYLQKALMINPASIRAQKGMQWALQRQASL